MKNNIYIKLVEKDLKIKKIYNESLKKLITIIIKMEIIKMLKLFI